MSKELVPQSRLNIFEKTRNWIAGRNQGQPVLSSSVSKTTECEDGQTEKVVQPQISQNASGSSLNPDVQAGMKRILDERVPDYVKFGRVSSLQFAGSEFARGAEMAGAARFEKGAKEGLKGQIEGAVAQNLSIGLSNTYSIVELQIRNGIAWNIGMKGAREKIEELFSAAEELNAPLSFIPKNEKGERADSPVVMISTKEQALAYLEDVVDKNLIRGMKRRIETIGFDVRCGLINKVEDGKKELDEYVEILRERGYEIVDEPVQEITGGAKKNGIVVRKVNEQEIRQLVDEQIKGNLARGVKSMVNTVIYRTQQGLDNPMESVQPEKIGFCKETGTKFGLVDQGMQSIVQGDRFNPDLIGKDAVRVFKENFSEGVKSITNSHLSYILKGNLRMAEFVEGNLEEYIALAKQYGIVVDEATLQQNLSGNLTPENIQEGLRSILEGIKETLRRGNFHFASQKADEVSVIRGCVSKTGLYGKVDFSEVDGFLKEANIKEFQLT